MDLSTIIASLSPDRPIVVFEPVETIETFELGAFMQVDEFACHDASCRPPTSGGTGGSKPGGGLHIEVSQGGKKNGVIGIRDHMISGMTEKAQRQLVEHFQKAVPGGSHVKSPEDAVKLVEERLRATVDMAMEKGYTAHMAQSAAKWYDVANDYAGQLTAQHGFTHPETAAAVLATLSPSAAWESNVANGAQVLRYVGSNPIMTREHAEYVQHRTARVLSDTIDNIKKGKAEGDIEELTAALDRARTPEALADIERKISGRRFNDLDDDMAILVLHGETQKNGVKGTSLIPSPDGSYRVQEDSGKAIIQSRSNMAKALRIARADKNGADAEEMTKVISDNVSNESKVRAFYMNIAHPNDTRQSAITADTHFFSAAIGVPLNSTSAKPFFTSTSEIGFARGYPAHREALARILPYLTERLGVSSGSHPRSAQSVLWEMERFLVPEKAKGAFIKDEAKMAELERIYETGDAAAAKRYYIEASGARQIDRVGS